MSGQNKNRKISFLGIILGIMWAAIIVFVISGINNYGKYDDYAPRLGNLANLLERQEFARFHESVGWYKEAGITASESEVHGEMLATADFIDALMGEAAYEKEGDAEMINFYEKKEADAIYGMGDLAFSADQIRKRFLQY